MFLLNIRGKALLSGMDGRFESGSSRRQYKRKKNMATLADLKPSFSELSESDRLDLVKRIQASRLVSKKPRKKAAAKQAGKIHIWAITAAGVPGCTVMVRALCGKTRPKDKRKPRIRHWENIRKDEMKLVCKSCLKKKEKEDGGEENERLFAQEEASGGKGKA